MAVMVIDVSRHLQVNAPQNGVLVDLASHWY